MKKHKYGKDSKIIGKAAEEYFGTILLKTMIGGPRILFLSILTGEK